MMQRASVQVVRAEQRAMSAAFKKMKARKGVKTKKEKRAAFEAKKQKMLRR